MASLLPRARCLATSGADDAGVTIASWLEESGMGKWVISAALLAILAIAFWASYGLWIRVLPAFRPGYGCCWRLAAAFPLRSAPA